MIKKYGLIGFPLSHSFSPSYFKNKFEEENIHDCSYQAYPIESIHDLKGLIQEEGIYGLNVTIPYKEQVIPFLDEIDDDAKKIGAINTILIRNGKLKGYNTDIYGFQQSWLNFMGKDTISKTLILGTGGAAKAVAFVLQKLNIEYIYVSRSGGNHLSYKDLRNMMTNYSAIINTTPLGMYPNEDGCPEIPYDELSNNHFCYDLIYNPQKTLFLTKAENQGARITNGYEMLVLQAEKSWQIWND